MNRIFGLSEGMSIAVHLRVKVAGTTDFSSTRIVAEEMGLSSHHMAKVVQKLVKAGILESVRGAQGGVRLAKSAAEISVYDLFLLTEEPEREGCLLPCEVCPGKRCFLGRWLAKEKSRLTAIMRRTTVDAVAGSLKNGRNKKVKE